MTVRRSSKMGVSVCWSPLNTLATLIFPACVRMFLAGKSQQAPYNQLHKPNCSFLVIHPEPGDGGQGACLSKQQHMDQCTNLEKGVPVGPGGKGWYRKHAVSGSPSRLLRATQSRAYTYPGLPVGTTLCLNLNIRLSPEEQKATHSSSPSAEAAISWEVQVCCKPSPQL